MGLDKQILKALRKAPKEAESAVYCDGEIAFFTNGTHQFCEELGENVKINLRYSENRFIAHKESGKWKVDEILTNKQIKQFIDFVEHKSETDDVSIEKAFSDIMIYLTRCHVDKIQ